jgi:intracellular sulfur oxidation DsrE/DsrF family protein
MYRIIIFCLAIFATTTVVFAQNQNNDKTEKAIGTQHKVVFHLTTNDTLAWKGLMNNIKNLKAAWGDSVQIEVVTNGLGIQFLMTDKTTQLQKIVEYKSKGVVFYACENTMKEKNITKDAMIPQTEYVPMGIGEIIKKEEQGWSYIKAGN